MPRPKPPTFDKVKTVAENRRARYDYAIDDIYEAGIALTPAGASFPHGDDPRDRNIRLAPTFPVLPEVETAMAGVATCVALAAAESLSGA